MDILAAIKREEKKLEKQLGHLQHQLSSRALQLTDNLHSAGYVVFALLVGPPATAQALTPRAGLSLALSVAFALLVTWVGLAISYFSIYPLGFYITSLAFGIYVLAQIARRAAARLAQRRGSSPSAPSPDPSLRVIA